MPTDPALQSLQNALKENCCRGVGGFLRYFEGQTWSDSVENILQRHETVIVVEELSASLWDLRSLDAMDEWFASFQTLIFAADHPTVHFGSEPITTSDSSYHASIYIDSDQLSDTIGSTRVYGEYHHGAASISSTDDDDFLRFAARAIRVFNAQPARCFLHAFLLRGETLELWVFDRSGAYSSGVLDIACDPNLPLRVLAGYGMMSDRESGMNMLIKRLSPTDGNYILPGQTPKLCFF